MAVAKRDLMEVVDYYNHVHDDDQGQERSARGPTIAINGHVYGSRNHPSFMRRQRREVGKPSNVKDIIHTMDKARKTQETMRKRKEKYESFIVEPMMGRKAIEVPGINMKDARRLQQRGIRSATDLREIYLDIGEKDFIAWMEKLGIDASNSKEAGQAIRDWCTTYLKLPR